MPGACRKHGLRRSSGQDWGRTICRDAGSGDCCQVRRVSKHNFGGGSSRRVQVRVAVLTWATGSERRPFTPAGMTLAEVDRQIGLRDEAVRQAHRIRVGEFLNGKAHGRPGGPLAHRGEAGPHTPGTWLSELCIERAPSAGRTLRHEYCSGRREQLWWPARAFSSQIEQTVRDCFGHALDGARLFA